MRSRKKAHLFPACRSNARWLAIGMVWLGCLVTQAEPPKRRPVADLGARLQRALLDTAAPGAHWGVKAVSLQTGRTLFETNAGGLFVPASNTKLFTAALALDRLGPEQRLATTVWVPASAKGETVTGDLLVVGGGDPTLCDRLHGGNWQEVFAPFVTAVTKAGIRRIQGDLVCDASLFRGPPFGSGWNWDDLGAYYGAPVSALSANDNVVHVKVTPGKSVGAAASFQLEPIPGGLEPVGNVRTGPTNAPSNLRLERLPGETRLQVGGVVPLEGGVQAEDIPVPSPARYFGELFRLALQRAGVSITGQVRPIDWVERAATPFKAGDWRQLASVPSPPMGDVVKEMMKPSQNFYAQSLWLLAGVQAERAPVGKEVGLGRLETTEDSGLRALRTFLGSAGITGREVALEEGSGLSRKNLVSPDAVVKLLVHMNRHSARKVWLDALPVGGVDGTLKGRFTSGDAKGKVRAKTGTLRYVSALGGYVDTKGGETVAFSVLVNGFVPAKDGATAVRETDRLVEMLAGFSGKSDRE